MFLSMISLWTLDGYACILRPKQYGKSFNGFMAHPPFLILVSLVFDVLPDDIDGNAASREQAEALIPEVFLPQLLPYGREFLLDASAARALVGVDELAQFGFRLGGEHDMDMIDVMIPFFADDAVVRSDGFEHLS